MANHTNAYKSRKKHIMTVKVIYDPDGPTLSELLNSPDMRGFFEGLLITGSLLKPETRSKYFPNKPSS